MESESEKEVEVTSESKTTQKIEVSVDRVEFRAALPDGFLAFRTSTPEVTHFGHTKTEAKIALLQHEAKL